eukprot:29549_1
MKNVLLIWLLCIKLIHLSVVKGFIEAIGDAVGDAVPDIPYIDKIPSIVSQVNSIPSIISKVKNIPTIVSQVDNMVGVIYYGTDGIDRRRLIDITHICAQCELARKTGIYDAVADQCNKHCPQSESAEGGLGFGSGIPGIGTAVEKVQDLAKQIPEIGTTLDTVQDLAEKIPEIVKIVRVFVSNPVGTKLGVGNEVVSLANTLKICLNQMTELVNPKQAFDSILDITDIDLNIIGGISDIPDLTYKVLAFMLLPFKPAIELSCDKGLPMAIDILKTTVQRINGRRRRMAEKGEEEIPSERCPKSDSGDNIFCASEHISYFYDDTSNHMFRLMADGFGDLIPDPKDNSDTEVAQEIRIARFTFQLVATIVGDLCDALDQCIPDEVSVAAYCADGIACGVVKVIAHSIIDVLDYVIGSADLQDGEINNFRLKAIFNDRISIIHNQKLILDTIKEGVMGTTNQIENSENTEIYSLKKISDKIDKLKCGSAAKTEAGKFVMDGKENEGEIMIIKLKSIHLYYGIIIFMSCCVFCIIFPDKCCC